MHALRKVAAPAAALVLAAARAGAADAPDSALHGDARVRLELRDSTLPDAASHRLLLRARAGVTATPAPGLSLGLGLTTAGPDAARVTDVELGHGPPPRPVALDQAWIAWRPDAVPGLALTAGRMNQPLLCVQDLLYDGDWRPDGFAASWSPRPRGPWRPHVRAGALWLTGTDLDDLALGAAQAAAEWRRGDEWRFLGGAGFHAFEDTAGRDAPAADGPAAGNSTWTGGRCAPCGRPALTRDYRVAEAFAQLTWDPWVPVTVYGQALRNTATSDEAAGWLAGVTLGRARAVGAVEIGWNVRRLEADATLAAAADSDFAGGGTDVEGHKVYVRCHVVRDVLAGLTWFDGVRDPDGARLRERLGWIDVTVRF